MKPIRHILTALSLVALLGVTAADAIASDRGARLEQASASVAVKGGAGQIELSVTGGADVKFHIYSITGQLVKTVVVAEGSALVDLPRGLYIVKCDYCSKQVVVR